MEIICLEGVEGIVSEEQGHKNSWDDNVSKSKHGKGFFHSGSEVSGEKQLDGRIKIFGDRHLKG